ncbi:hypothetical protein NMY22_g16852 [Coprinellus aureogranulatus]|nr:hypothetical protein NMY22_g16852 [Coprinellus aureogranulatus]
MTAEFGIKFGKNMNDLAAWQKLCKRIGIDPVPVTLESAHEEFKATHVNIVELMTIRIKDGEIKIFDTEEELAQYTRSTEGLTFPRRFVERRGILWYLLRRIWNPLPEAIARGVCPLIPSHKLRSPPTCAYTLQVLQIWNRLFPRELKALPDEQEKK